MWHGRVTAASTKPSEQSIEAVGCVDHDHMLGPVEDMHLGVGHHLHQTKTPLHRYRRIAGGPDQQALYLQLGKMRMDVLLGKCIVGFRVGLLRR